MKLLCYLLLACLMPAFALEWTPDLEEAKQHASAENKLVLALFSGSEFTRRHANMRKEVFDSSAFCDYAEDKFVAVEMWEPRDRVKHAAAIWKLRALSLEYAVKSWPTALVLTPEGIPTGGVMGAARYETIIHGEAYRARTLHERLNIICTAFDNAIHVAKRLREVQAMPEGEEKLRALAATYARLPENLKPRIAFAKYVAEQDPQNLTGLQDEYLDMQQMVEWGELGRYGMDRATTLRRQQEMIARARPANLLTMLEGHYNTRSHSLKTPEDIHAYTLAMEAYTEQLEKTRPEEAAAIRQHHAERYGTTSAQESDSDVGNIDEDRDE